jgi:hypothetical protein
VRRTIVIAETFYQNPDSVAAYAKTLSYMSPYNTAHENRLGSRVAWRASRWRPAHECPFKSSEELIRKLEFLTGEILDRDYWNRDFPVDADGYPICEHKNVPHGAWWNCTFHSKHHDQRLGEGVHSHTDRDGWNAVGDDGWAGLIYLDKDAHRQSGLRTWENVNPGKRYDWMTPKENWVLCDTLANLYNRIILHRGDLPHSGAAGWGHTVSDGRFYQTLFFRTLSKPRTPGVSIALPEVVNE